MNGSLWPRRLPGGSDKTGVVTPDELLLRTARGDERAFEQLYDLFARSVFGLVRRVIRDVAQSEEVTQEVFVELWRTAGRFRPEQGGARTWALTLAHRRAVDRVRTEHARAEREKRTERLSPRRGFDVVDETVSHVLEREQVRRCLDQLTDLQRESIELAYYDGRTYPEVASLLDAPLGTVKTRLRDGLIRLRDCLGATG